MRGALSIFLFHLFGMFFVLSQLAGLRGTVARGTAACAIVLPATGKTCKLQGKHEQQLRGGTILECG